MCARCEKVPARCRVKVALRHTYLSVPARYGAVHVQGKSRITSYLRFLCMCYATPSVNLDLESACT